MLSRFRIRTSVFYLSTICVYIPKIFFENFPSVFSVFHVSLGFTNPCFFCNFTFKTFNDGIDFIYEKEGRRWFEMFTGQNEDIDYIECVAFKFGMVSLKLWRCDIKDCVMTTNKDDAAMPYITK